MDRLEQAAQYIAKGDEYYAKAADEIIAAREEGYTWEAIAEGVGKSLRWCQTLVSTRKSAQPDADSLKVDWQRGSHATTEEIREGAKKLLHSAPIEQVEEIVHSLPEERAAEVGAIIGKQVGGFKAMSIKDHIAQAREDLGECVSNGTLTPESLDLIENEWKALGRDLEFARAMGGVSA